MRRKHLNLCLRFHANHTVTHPPERRRQQHLNVYTRSKTLIIVMHNLFFSSFTLLQPRIRWSNGGSSV
jgi:hypothetical protein